jgi:hypothetical protein
LSPINPIFMDAPVQEAVYSIKNRKRQYAYPGLDNLTDAAVEKQRVNGDGL